MLDFGTVKPGTLLNIPFHTFDSNDPSASVTITGLATTDIEVYKDGGNTARASDNGYALLGGDGIDEFGVGVHGFSIDLADNTTDDFYEAGSQYFVVVDAITVDGATIRFIAATWTIGYPGAILDTIITTRTSATVFVLEEGAPDDDAYNGCIVYIHDQASAVQFEIGVCSDYAGSTKTLTLAVDPGIFTTVAGDNISIMPPSSVTAWNSVLLATTNPLPNAASDAAGGLPISDLGGLDLDAKLANTNEVTVARMAALTDWIDGGRLDLLLDAIPTTAMRGTDDAALASVCTEVRLVELDAANLPADIDAILVDTGITLKAELDGIQTDTEDIQTRIPTALVGGRIDATIDATGMEAGAVDNILDEVYEGTTTLRQFLRLAAAALFGKLSGAATTTVSIRNEADDADRIVATVDADGNRSSVILDKT